MGTGFMVNGTRTCQKRLNDAFSFEEPIATKLCKVQHKGNDDVPISSTVVFVIRGSRANGENRHSEL